VRFELALALHGSTGMADADATSRAGRRREPTAALQPSSGGLPAMRDLHREASSPLCASSPAPASPASPWLSCASSPAPASSPDRPRRLSIISLIVALIVAVAGAPRVAHAGEGADPLDASYLWNGGALPFFWGALGADAALGQWGSPRQTPLLFSADEGGLPRSSWEIPGWALRAGAGTVGLAIAIGGDDSKWYHVKGFAESMATVGFLTHALKLTFGRHRPYYTPGSIVAQERKSFPSGHSTNAFAIAAYSALYLRWHVFGRSRDTGTLVTTAEALTYAGLAAGATALALERVFHNRHHVTDLIGGAVLGTATSVAFFFYQEHRYQRRESGAPARTLLPSVGRGGALLQLGTVF
jgi:membrane-associated phospholipid phosphatase